MRSALAASLAQTDPARDLPGTFDEQTNPARLSGSDERRESWYTQSSATGLSIRTGLVQLRRSCAPRPGGCESPGHGPEPEWPRQPQQSPQSLIEQGCHGTQPESPWQLAPREAADRPASRSSGTASRRRATAGSSRCGSSSTPTRRGYTRSGSSEFAVCCVHTLAPEVPTFCKRL